MNNVKTYNTRVNINVTPSVAYYKTLEDVAYEKGFKFTSDKTKAKAGDLVVSNSNSLYFTDLDFYIGNGKYFYDGDDDNLYPTGVVVVPADHTDDGTVRICSLNYVDYKNREGSYKPVSIYWGAYDKEIEDLTDYDLDTAQSYIPGTTTTSTGNNAYIPTNNHRVKHEHNIDDQATYWHWCREVDGDSYFPSPYNANETKSTIYHTSDTLLADMDGKANTEILRTFTNDGDGYSLDNVLNVSSSSYCTAAIACLAYRASFFGDTYFDYSNDETRGWYLPSIGELGYLCARIEKIDRVRRFFGAAPLWNTWLWSSTEYSQYNAWDLNLYEDYFGYVYNTNKYNNGSVVAFAAF